ncbi:maleylpyruvate isomerase family mycothiol-dependent enzyme [Streptodolium elevatio]|uniref:Maleylpyruvate isomerase family mycothiol-dependent enzyme n=1 Tax=Streptodolium elevatio TaxID=3157996 RepID=A0ABV3DL23_9ACTN
MDLVARFRGEVALFEAAVRQAAAEPEAPPVPSCPGWTVSDLVLHLGEVHRVVEAVLRTRLTDPPQGTDPGFGLPAERQGWPEPGGGPTAGPVPAALVEWFADGARLLGDRFAKTDPATRVWTWAPEQSAGFWLRMQAIEAAVHRWDAELSVGEPGPMDRSLACDAVAQTFEVMAPGRRERLPASEGAGETYRLAATDGPESWTVRFSGADVEYPARGGKAGEAAAADVELRGSASDLMLYLWGRVPLDRLAVAGDRSVAERYFVLVPPV